MSSNEIGYDSDIINQLATMLSDKYDFHSIMKELFQNADDAGSEELHIAFVENLPGSQHPLMQGPLFIVLDDGDFTTANMEGISRIGAGSKSSDSASIGRFGLGMKSIHHLCEAYFYMANPNQPAANGNYIHQLICPWFNPGIGEPLYQEWKECDDVYQLLINTIEQWGHNCNKWFALIVPLRSPDHVSQGHPLCNHDNRYPKLDDIKKENSYDRLTNLMPLMRNLKKVSIWNSVNSEDPDIIINIAPGAETCRYPKGMSGEKITLPIKFQLDTYTSPNEINSQDVLGYESYLSDDTFTALKACSTWPTTSVFDRNSGRQTVPIPAEPHCAVTIKISKKYSPKAKLVLGHAVFLPLSDLLIEEFIPGEYDFQILLHGIFFLDSGRRHIYTKNNMQSQVQVDWDEKVVESISFLFLYVLDFLATKNIIDNDALHILTTALNNNMDEDLNDGITVHGSWFFCLEGVEGDGEWKRIEEGNAVYTIPLMKSDPSIQFKVFPMMKRIVTSFDITYQNYSYLAAVPPRRCNTNNSIFRDIFAILSEKVFKEPKELDYLLVFIRNIGILSVDDGSYILHKLFPLLKQLKDKDIENIKDKLAELFLLMPEKVVVTLNASVSEATIEWLNEQIINADIDINRFFISENILQDHPTQIKIEECCTIFRTIESDKTTTTKSSLAIALVDKTEGEEKDKLIELKRFRVFSIKEFFSDKEQVLSWEDLYDLYDDGQLYGDKGGSRFISLLNKAVKSVDFFRIRQEDQPFRILFNNEQIPTSNKISCYEMLLNCPELTDVVEDRVTLFDALLTCPASYDKDHYKQAMRYLIHADEDHAPDLKDAMLVQQETYQELASLGRITEAALNILDTNWLWVPQPFANIIAEKDKKDINITNVNNSILEDFISKTGCDWLLDLNLAEEERIELLKSIQNEKLWKDLPFHKTVNDEYTNLTGDGFNEYFIETENPIEKSEMLKELFCFIRRPLDPVLIVKYENHLLPASPDNILDEIFITENPSLFFQDILNAFTVMGMNNESMGGSLINRAMEAEWVPTVYSDFPPKYIIDIAEAENEIKAIVELCEDPQYISVSHLNNDLLSCEGFEYIRENLFQRGKEGLSLLSELCEDLPYYALGSFDISMEKFEFILQCFEDLGRNDYPIISLLKKIYNKDNFSYSELQNDFLPAVNQIPSLQISQKILLYLYKKHKSVKNRVEKKELLDYFKLYLKDLLDSPEFTPESLKMLYFRNRDGVWKTAKELGFNATGIKKSYLVEKEISKILLENDTMSEIHARHITSKSKKTVQPKTNKNDFYDYVRAMAKKIDPSVVGGFLALLGNNNDKITNIATDLLSPRTIESFRNRINWSPVKIKSFHGEGDGKIFYILDPNERMGEITRDSSINDLMNCHSFDIFLNEGKTEKIFNLCGDMFETEIEDEYDSLILGNVASDTLREEEDWNRFFSITLRKIDVERIDPEQLLSLMKKTIFVLLQEVYTQTSPGLDELLEDFSKTEQLQISVVQNIILYNGVFYLKQMGEIPSMHDIVKAFNKCGYNRAESLGNPIKERKAEEEYKKCLEMFKEIISDEDSPFIEETLSVVKRKIQQYQYDASSVPFEIFQNADDAYTELDRMNLTRSLCDFQIHVKNDTIIFIHNGRPINCFRNFAADFTSEDGKKLNFHRDLEKMLVFSYSDKGDSDIITTGQFGLGFKSAYLLSDSPKVISSQHIAFKIIGGFYPQALSEKEKNSIISSFSKSKEIQDETVIYLESSAEKIKSAMAHFLSQSQIQLLFSKRISVLNIVNNNVSFTVKCELEKIDGIEDLSKGNLNFSIIDPDIDDQSCLRLGNEKSSLLLAYDMNRGVVKLPEHINNIWVTTPLKGEGCGAGLAINGDFNIDVGRSCLAANQDGKLDDIAFQLRESFKELINLSENWGEFQQILNIRTSKYLFFKSVYDLFITTTKETAIDKIIWHENFFPYLLMNYPILPNGLYGEYADLISVKNIKYIITGVLAKEISIFNTVIENMIFQKSFPKNEMISEHIVKKAKNHAKINVSSQKISFSSFLKKQIGTTKEISPKNAVTLSLIFTKKNIDLLKNNEYIEEFLEIRELLRNLKFKSKAGSYQELTSLVIKEKNEILASFSPSEHLLANSYKNDALLFVYFCLGESDINTKREEIITWGIDADDDISKVAFLKYILDADLNMHRMLRSMHKGSWLEEIKNDSEILSDFQDDEKMELLYIIQPEQFLVDIRKGVGDNIPQEEGSPFIDEDDPDDVVIIDDILEDDLLLNVVSADEVMELLNSIYEWWDKRQDKYLKEYERSIYYTEKLFDISDNIPESSEEKIAWMNFLLTGILHKIGRANFGAHRNFVRTANEKQWIDSFIHEKSWNSFACFDEYLNNAISEFKYHQWIYKMFDLRIISLGLSETVEVILNAGHSQFNEEKSLKDLFNTKASPDYQGGGIYTYPLLPIFGIGIHYVLRELVRNRIIENSGIHQHCYLPLLRVRRIFEAMGCGFTLKEDYSKTMFNFLQKYLGDNATFNNCFDIPFLIIANDEKLQEQFKFKDKLSLLQKLTSKMTYRR